MATIGNNDLTLLDWAKRIDPDGAIAMIAEILNETNEVLNDMVVVEGNLPTGHRTTVRTGLPTVAFRKINEGVARSKSRTAQVDETAGMLEAFSEVDQALAMLNGNTAAFRLSEDRAFLESMNQTFVETLFFGDTDVNPERFLGFSPRYSDLTTSENSDNVLDGAGVGADNTSVWLVVWGVNTIHGFFPKGGRSGLRFEDLGEDVTTDANDGRYRIFRSHYKWDFGLNVKDWRFAVRIANIDVSDLTLDAATGANLLDLMTQALEIPPNLTAGRPSWYVNRTISSFLRRQAINKANVELSIDEVAGKRMTMFGGVPVRRVDELLNTEAALT